MAGPVMHLLKRLLTDVAYGNIGIVLPPHPDFIRIGAVYFYVPGSFIKLSEPGISTASVSYPIFAAAVREVDRSRGNARGSTDGCIGLCGNIICCVPEIHYGPLHWVAV